MGVLSEACLSFVSTGVNKGKGDIDGKERTCVAIDRRTGGLGWFRYTPVFTVRYLVELPGRA